MARNQQGFTVIPLRFDEEKNFKEVVATCCPNMKLSTQKERVNPLKIKWIQVRKESPRSIFVNYGFQEEMFMEINVSASE